MRKDSITFKINTDQGIFINESLKKAFYSK